MNNQPEFIVAEVSKNWPDPAAVEAKDFLATRFEHAIAFNLDRGYVLHSFCVHRLLTEPGHMNETIIAVFRRV